MHLGGFLLCLQNDYRPIRQNHYRLAPVGANQRSFLNAANRSES
jgi:hypothetical protein